MSKIQIDEENNTILMKLPAYFEESEAKRLIKYLKLIKSKTKVRGNVLILPKNGRVTEKGRSFFRIFQNIMPTYIVVHSPIQRALMKTEAIFQGGKPDVICCSKEEALKRITSSQSLFWK